jgi:hypothetical protein
MHCKTLMGTQVIEERRIRDAIANYFAPVSVEKTRKHSESL